MSELPLFSKEAQSLKPGFYQHYKNKKYKVLGIARHSETLEELVVYQAQYGDFSIWTRPVKMFRETVMYKGKEVPRFKFIGE